MHLTPKKLITGLALAATLTAGTALVPMAAQAATLQMAWSQDATGLDPHKQTAFSSLRLLELIYEPLVRNDAKLDLVPAIAKSWEFSDDAKTLTFHLDPNAKFSTGDKVTSADVKASFERILDEQTGAAARANYALISSIDTPDDETVVFNLSAAGCADPRRHGERQRRHRAGECHQGRLHRHGCRGLGPLHAEDLGAEFQGSACRQPQLGRRQDGRRRNRHLGSAGRDGDCRRACGPDASTSR